MTSRQRLTLAAVRRLAAADVSPTVRQVADAMETDEPESERVSDDEARGQLEALERNGLVDQFPDEDGRERYQPRV